MPSFIIQDRWSLITGCTQNHIGIIVLIIRMNVQYTQADMQALYLYNGQKSMIINTFCI